jgi:peptidoglycan/xylan/chitin deacetylase (PgdA/CDA1 family)
MYHAVEHVDEDPNALCVRPGRFEAQMGWLARHGWHGVSVRELLNTDRDRRRRLVGLTFDDGYCSFRSHAVPVLEHFGFTASVYVSSSHLGGQNTWDAHPRLDLMGGDDLVDVGSRGMEVGSHGTHHVKLTGLSDDARALELSESRTRLSETVGCEIDGFAYPYGDASREVASQARAAGYRYAVTHKRGDRQDPWLLPRRYVGQADTAVRLVLKLAFPG